MTSQASPFVLLHSMQLVHQGEAAAGSASHLFHARKRISVNQSYLR